MGMRERVFIEPEDMAVILQTLRQVESTDKAFDPDQARDDNGRWTDEGSSGSTTGGNAGKVTPEQHEAVTQYMWGDSYAMNSNLRSGEPLTPSMETMASHLDALIEASKGNEPYGPEAMLYRACRSEVFDNMKPGDVFVDRGFVSTTTSEDYAHEFAGYAGHDAQTVIMPSVGGPRTGISVDALLGEDSMNQKEIILPRGTSFVFLGRDSDGKYLLARRS